jgi:hypothetical protein
MAFITDHDVRTVIPKGCSDSGERFCGGNLGVANGVQVANIYEKQELLNFLINNPFHKA